MPVRQGVLDIGETDLVVKRGQSLGRVITKDPVDHDLFLAWGEPRLAEEDTRGLGRALGQPTVGEHGDGTGQGSLEGLIKEIYK